MISTKLLRKLSFKALKQKVDIQQQIILNATLHFDELRKATELHTRAKKAMELKMKPILKQVKEVIVCESLEYRETNYYKPLKKGEKGSTYVTFAAYNKRYGCCQSVTWDVVCKALDFSVWRTQLDEQIPY